jgi:EAL domain-containing protein (putative c-di-GMP-specific phosphodiesterase class I)
MLEGMGCDAAQGYYLSRPVPADEVQAWVTGRPVPVEA